MPFDLLAFGLVIFFALVGSIISIRFGQSPIVGMLLVGALVGPKTFGLVQFDDAISSFAEIGSVLLLFTIGIELNLRRVLRFGLRALIVGIFKMLFIIMLTYEAGLLVGLQETDAILLSVILSITSTTIFAGVVKNMAIGDSREINLLMAVLILEDIFGVFILTLLSSFSNLSGTLKADLLVPLAQGFILLAISYAIISRVIKPVARELAKYNNELLIISALALCALMSAFTKYVGLEASIGAFLAGTIISSTDEFKGIERSMIPFISVFSLFFFFTIGMEVNLFIVYTAFGLLVFINVLNLALKFFSVSASTYFLGFNAQEAVFSGVAMLSVGEFSLLIAREAAKFSTIDLLGLTSVTVLVSTVFTTMGVRNTQTIESTFTKLFPRRLQTTFSRISIYLNQVVSAFEPDGLFFNAFMSVWSSVAFDIAMLAIINGGLFLLQAFVVTPYFEEMLPGWDLGILVKILELMLSLPFLLSLFRAFKRLLDALSESFLMAEGRNDSIDMRIYGDLRMAVLFILMAFGWPLLVVYFKLTRAFDWLGILPIFLAALYLWDMSKAVHMIFEREREL